MRKIVYLVLVTAVILSTLLTGCSNKPVTGRGTVLDLFGGATILYYPQGREFHVVASHKDSLDVVVDNQPYTLIDPDHNSYVIIAEKDKNGRFGFWRPERLLDVAVWKNKDNNYVAFEGSYELMYPQNGITNTLILFKAEDLPSYVSPESWNNTETTLCVLENPGSPKLVQNLNTGELVYLLNDVTTIDDSHRFYDLDHGQCFSGYVKVSEDQIYITQSEPDNVQMNLAYEKVKGLPDLDLNVADAIDACIHDSFAMVEYHSITKEQIKDWCGVYTPDMSSWK